MSETINAGNWRAVSEDDDGMPALVGYLGITDDGRLSLLGAEEGEEEDLQELVSYMNEKEGLDIEVEPPEDARPHAVYTRTVARDEPEFLGALADYLDRYYDIRLEPARPEELPPGATDYRDDPYREDLDVAPPRRELAPKPAPPPPRKLP